MLKIIALTELLRRYKDVFLANWKMRKQLNAYERQSYELAFLPANIELAEAPVHPAPYWTMRIIVILTLVLISISLFGRLDIVVVAKGKVIPDARVKEIQPAITGVVRHIYVDDGQRVNAGNVLMVLGSTQAEADLTKTEASRAESMLAIIRAKALLDAQISGHVPEMKVSDGLSQADVNATSRFADGIFMEYKDKLNRADAELTQHRDELATTLQDIERLKSTAPLAREQANSYKLLAKDHYVARNDYLDKEQTALGQEHDLTAKRSHANELKAAIDAQIAEKASVGSQFRREQLDALEQAEQKLKQSVEDEVKAKTRKQLLNLVSPVSGTVQQLSVHTIGGVVTSAQKVMEIVPDDAMEVEVNIANKDIGFIKEGQNATVKIDAFPYTYYGYIKGNVISVSNDAVQDRNHGLNFTARVHLDKSGIEAGGRWIKLTPGMTVSAEIKTGKRNVWQYFFDPLIRMSNESLHER